MSSHVSGEGDAGGSGGDGGVGGDGGGIGGAGGAGGGRGWMALKKSLNEFELEHAGYEYSMPPSRYDVTVLPTLQSLGST